MDEYTYCLEHKPTIAFAFNGDKHRAYPLRPICKSASLDDTKAGAEHDDSREQALQAINEAPLRWRGAPPFIYLGEKSIGCICVYRNIAQLVVFDDAQGHEPGEFLGYLERHNRRWLFVEPNWNVKVKQVKTEGSNGKAAK